jgi:hypothetical protein
VPAQARVGNRLRALVASTSGDARLFAIAYLLLLPFYLAPLYVTAPLFPGLDLPFHLSMADMLSKSGRPDSPYAAFYQGSPAVAPYAAHYLALWLMGKVMPILAAHTILVGLYVAGMPLAMASLLNVLGRSRLPALLAFPVAYSLPLNYGFISFAFSLPVLVWLLAQLARLLLAPPPVGRRWLGVAALALLLFLCHLQNFVYGVCAAGAFVLFAAVPWRRRLAAMAAFIPAVGALAYWQLTLRADPWHRPRGLAFAWHAVKYARLRDLPRGEHPWLADLKEHLLNIPVNTLRGYADRSEVQACNALLLLIGVYFLVGIAGRYVLPGPQGERPRMRTSAWVAFLGAFAAYFLLPHHLSEFDIVTFFPRFAPLVVLMMLPLIPRGLRRFTGSLGVLLAVPALAFCAAWGVQLTRHYRAYADETADFRAVMDAARPGYRLLGLPFERRSRVMAVESAMIGMANFYPLLKPSPKSMVPVMYCDMMHMPCVRRPPLDAVPDPTPWLPDHLDENRGVAFFDYFLVRSPPPRLNLFGRHKNEVELVSHHGSWWLYMRKGAIEPVAKEPRR